MFCFLTNRLVPVMTFISIAVASVQAAPRPNVLLIFTDDQGIHDVSCYGSEIPTPNIDSIAKAGVKFESWYVSAPVCTPSRFSLMTGKHPFRSQDKLYGALMFLNKKHRGIRPEETTIAEILKRQGYRTGLIGKWHLGHSRPEFLPTRHGFDVFYGHTGGCIDFFKLTYGNQPDWYRGEKHVADKGFATDLLTREAVRFIEVQTANTPFFLYLAYNAPHYGKPWDAQAQKPANVLQAQEKDLKRFEHIQDKDRQTFAACVANMDDGVGEVLAALEKQKLADDTLVIFMTDNGGSLPYGGNNEPYRGEKATVFEGGIRVPCLMRWPGKIQPGTLNRHVASALDIFPTLCHLAGAKTDGYQLDGVDLVPALVEGQPIGQRELFWLYHTAYALRRGPWKFVRTMDGEELLFNIQKDPYEKVDLAAKKPEILEDLKQRYAAVIPALRPKP